MAKSNYLEVFDNKTRQAELSGNEFIMSTFRAVKFVDGRSVFSDAKAASRIFNPGREPKLGDVFEGTIMELPTTQYPIGTPAKMVNKITVVVFSDESALELANQQLARHKASVLVNGKASVDWAKLEAEEKAKIKKAAKAPKGENAEAGTE